MALGLTLCSMAWLCLLMWGEDKFWKHFLGGVDELGIFSLFHELSKPRNIEIGLILLLRHIMAIRNFCLSIRLLWVNE